MSDTVDYLAQFGEHFGSYKSAKGTVENLGSTEIKRKISGRSAIRKKEKIAPHVAVPDAVIEKLAVGYEGIAHDALYGFFGENRDKILERLPDKNLEGKFLDILPVEVEGNDGHNEIAEMHANYLGVKELNKAYDEGKVKFAAYADPLSKVAAQQTAKELSQKEHLQESTVMLMAEARAELVGASEILARTMGGQLEAQAKKAVVGRIEEMERAKGKDQYTRVQYARNNLIHNEDEDYVIEMAGKCLSEKKKK